MKNYFLAAIALVAFVFSAHAQQGVDETSFGKGLLNFTAKDNSFSVKFAPRFQVRQYSSWDANGSGYDKAEHGFLVRRARLKFDGFAYSKNLKYKIELGLSNNDLSGSNPYTKNAPNQILDAVIMWTFAKNWELWAGQTKLPGNVERVVSSANLQLIDRSLLNSRFNIDRDLGIQLRHKSKWSDNFITREKFALSQGEGRNVTSGNEGGLQYTARFEVLPFGEFTKKGDYSNADLAREQSPKLMLTYTYNHNNNAVKTRSGLGSYMQLSDGSLYQTDINTTFVDAMFKYNGISVMAEYAKRVSDDPIAVNPNGSATGTVVWDGSAVNAQIGYLFKNNVELVGRYTSVDYAEVTSKADEKQYTIGISKYIVGHKLKVQSDLVKTFVGGENDNIQFRSGFELHF
ncbi:MAG: porin [Flavobacteriaceae bacterium]|nr:porin [Flavobacteriaceae bacterium]NVJ71704.1 porin [Flavobacteriaceae bacterium]